MIRITRKRKRSGACWRAARPALREAEAVVRPILEAVRKRGDRAVLEYARQFDGLTRKKRARAGERAARGAAELAPEFRGAVEMAAANIRRFAEMQMPREWIGR